MSDLSEGGAPAPPSSCGPAGAGPSDRAFQLLAGDLGLALQREEVVPERIVDVVERYMEADGAKVTHAMFEKNLAAKKKDPIFTADMTPLLAHGQAWNFDGAFEQVWTRLVARLPGESWKGD